MVVKFFSNPFSLQQLKMVKSQVNKRTPNVALEKVKPKNRNWKSQARVKYFHTKNYTKAGKQTRVITGVMQGRKKQFRFNIWSDKGVKTALVENQIYDISHGELDDKGVLNFGENAVIEKGIDAEDERFPQATTLSITQLLQRNQEEMIDMQGYILWVDDPYQWTQKDSGVSFKKQIVMVVDPILKFAVNLTLWSNFLSKDFQGSLCLFHGFKLKFYQGCRQISSTVYSTITSFDLFKIPAKDIQDIEYTSLSQPYKYRTLPELETELFSLLAGSHLYTKCRVEIKKCLTVDPRYLGCSKCYTKVINNFCSKCQALEFQPVPRLSLQLIVDDGHGTVLLRLFHRMALFLLSTQGFGISNQELLAMSAGEINKSLDRLVGTGLKIGMSSSVNTVESQRYNQHTLLQLHTI